MNKQKEFEESEKASKLLRFTKVKKEEENYLREKYDE